MPYDDFAAAPPEPPHPANPAMTLALIIEDDDRTATILRLQLESLGLGVATAARVADGLRLARERHPAVVLLDLILPGPSGWEALRQLKADPALATIPVVILSAAAHEAQGLAAGAARVLAKPLLRADLRRALGEIGVLPPAAARPRLLLAGELPRPLGDALARLDPARCEVLRAPNLDTLRAAAETLLPDAVVLAAALPAAERRCVAALRDSPVTFRIPVILAAELPPAEAEPERLLEAIAARLEQ